MAPKDTYVQTGDVSGKHLVRFRLAGSLLGHRVSFKLKLVEILVDKHVCLFSFIFAFGMAETPPKLLVTVKMTARPMAAIMGLILSCFLPAVTAFCSALLPALGICSLARGAVHWSWVLTSWRASSSRQRRGSW